MTVVSAIAFGGLTIAALLAFIRIVRPGSTADRVVALDAFAIFIAIGLGVQAATTENTVYIQSAIVIVLLGFVATIAIAYFIERRSS